MSDTPWHTGEIMAGAGHVYGWIDGALTSIDGRAPTEEEKAAHPSPATVADEHP